MTTPARAFEHGDFLRPNPSGNVHIASRVDEGLVTMSCGRRWPTAFLTPASGDHGAQCHACWDAM